MIFLSNYTRELYVYVPQNKGYISLITFQGVAVCRSIDWLSRMS